MKNKKHEILMEFEIASHSTFQMIKIVFFG